MTAILEKKNFVSEYLELEKGSEVRHEYVDGEILAMPGEKRVHNRLARRFVLLLEALADSKNCEVVIETVKIRTRGTRIRYPDIAISCAPGNDEYFLEDQGEIDIPCLGVNLSLEQIYAGIGFEPKIQEA
jgi:Uma2 family endonuclease